MLSFSNCRAGLKHPHERADTVKFLLKCKQLIRALFLKSSFGNGRALGWVTKDKDSLGRSIPSASQGQPCPWHLHPYRPSHVAGSPGRLGWPSSPLRSCSQVPAQAVMPNTRYCPATSLESGPWLRCCHHPFVHTPAQPAFFCHGSFSIPVSPQPESEVLAHNPKQRQKRFLVKRVFRIKENLSLKFPEASSPEPSQRRKTRTLGWSASWWLGCSGPRSGSQLQHRLACPFWRPLLFWATDTTGSQRPGEQIHRSG